MGKGCGEKILSRGRNAVTRIFVGIKNPEKGVHKAVNNVDERRGVMLFDQDCGFCTRAATAATGKFFRTSIEPVPLRSANLEELGLDIHSCEQVLHVVDYEGRIYQGSDAIATILRNSRWPWPLVGGIALLPGIRWVAQRGYRLVAKNRHKLPGGTTSCTLEQR